MIYEYRHAVLFSGNTVVCLQTAEMPDHSENDEKRICQTEAQFEYSEPNPRLTILARFRRKAKSGFILDYGLDPVIYQGKTLTFMEFSGFPSLQHLF